MPEGVIAGGWPYVVAAYLITALVLAAYSGLLKLALRGVPAGEIGALLVIRGRLNRAPFVSAMLSLTVMLAAWNALLLSQGSGGSTGLIFVTTLLVGAGSLTLLAVMATTIVRRLHDLDRPGTHWWLALVPIYNLYLGILLTFKKGTTGANRYGPDPLLQSREEPNREQ